MPLPVIGPVVFRSFSMNGLPGKSPSGRMAAHRPRCALARSVAYAEEGLESHWSGHSWQNHLPQLMYGLIDTARRPLFQLEMMEVRSLSAAEPSR